MISEPKVYEEQIESFFEMMERYAPVSGVVLNSDAWSLKEMVGHLIDSASNNHQRFIRLQTEKELRFPPYDAESWKTISHAQSCDYSCLITLWKSYNLYLLHIIKNADPKSLSNVWISEKGEKPLDSIIEDFFRHLEWHRELFLKRAAEIEAAGQPGNS
ncbi:DinB family protein [Breznakiella homolactica]|uniref:DinB family protein n=1 Tax=Breznakiella homolactica TaxID=2798577 RepID=A0A7T7XPN5_9SPIR|nr:DinB family protein [Breznakiella homolactica]QQO10087.1 DinB family protein [Breznakiella homolactica]